MRQDEDYDENEDDDDNNKEDTNEEESEEDDCNDLINSLCRLDLHLAGRSVDTFRDLCLDGDQDLASVQYSNVQ